MLPCLFRGLCAELARLRALLLKALRAPFALLLEALVDEAVVDLGLGLRFFETLAFQGFAFTFVLQALGGDEALDLGGFVVRFAVLLDNLPADDVLTHIVLLAQVEERLDLGGTLRTEAAGLDGVREAFKFGFALGNDNKGYNGNVGADNATTDRLALGATLAALTEARMTILKQQTYTVVD
jgi:hypothetical protein